MVFNANLLRNFLLHVVLEVLYTYDLIRMGSFTAFVLYLCPFAPIWTVTKTHICLMMVLSRLSGWNYDSKRTWSYTICISKSFPANGPTVRSQSGLCTNQTWRKTIRKLMWIVDTSPPNISLCHVLREFKKLWSASNKTRFVRMEQSGCSFWKLRHTRNM